MTYEEAKQAIDRYAELGSVYGLDGITRLMETLGRPERQLAVIHVAGTNGKGSTVTALAAILEDSGYHTMSYTSPEVSTYLDRFRIGGKPASAEAFVTAFGKTEAACQAIVRQGFPHPTIFEMELAISYLIALAEGARVMVQETGLGGRLDATNVVEQPALVIFTAIGMDHMQFLGDTPEAIAREKAGIIKPGVPVVACDNGPAINTVIRAQSEALGAACTFASADACEVTARSLDGQTIRWQGHTYHYPLIGTHQVYNLALILQAVASLRALGFALPETAVQKALAKVRWPGRFEVVHRSPVVVLDGAHNPQAASALADTVRTWFPDKKVHLLMHLFEDKDACGIFQALAPVTATLTLTTIDRTRSASPEALRGTAQRFLETDRIHTEADFAKALDVCLAACKPDDILIICGSLSHLEQSRRLLAQSERIK